MQIQQLFGEYFDELRVVHGEEEREGAEVDVVCGVYRLRGAEYCVGDGDAAAEERRVFYVVDA